MMVHPADADLSRMDCIAIQQLEVSYDGQAAHAAAAPHRGRNALDAAVLGYVNVAALRQHIRPTERVHGIFTRAGDKPNIVPEHAAALWYVRSDTMETLQPLKDRVLTCLEAGAQAAGCRCQHAWDDHPVRRLERQRPDASRVRLQLRPSRSGNPRARCTAAGGGLDRHGQRQLPRAVHPPDDPGRAARRAHPHAPSSPQHARGEAADRAVLDGAKAMAMTVIDLWADEELLGAGDRRSSSGPRLAARGRSEPTAGPRTVPPGHEPSRDRCGSGPSMTLRDDVRLGVVHPRRGGHPPALLHQPRRARLRAREPPRGREGGPVRPLLAEREEPPAPVPGRVHRRAGHRRRPDGGRHRRPQAGRRPLREGLLRVRRRLGGPARRRPPGLRAGVEPPDQDPRVGAAGQLSGAEHPLHRLRRSTRRSLSLLPGPGRAHVALRHPLRGRPGPPVRHLRVAGGRRAGPRARHRAQAGRRQRFRVPPGHAGQGARRGAGHPAGGVALERRDLRLGPGLRGPPDPHAHPPTARGQVVQRADAARAAQGDPELPPPGGPPRTGRGLERLPGADPHCHRGRREQALRGRSTGREPGGDPGGLGSRRRGEAPGRHLLRLVVAVGTPDRRAGAGPVHGRPGRADPGLRGRPDEPPSQARASLRAHRTTASTSSPTTGRSGTSSATGC